ncbi:MAG: D-Ala-D-Ala carboxypeptidase family metallohydrolase [Pseudomonadota bacterium]
MLDCSGYLRLRPSGRLSALWLGKKASLVAAAVLLSGCVASNGSAPRNLASVLTPTAAEKATSPAADQTGLSLAQTKQPETLSDLAPSTATALAPAEPAPAKAEEAADNVVASQAPADKPVTKTQTTAATENSADERAKSQPARKRVGVQSVSESGEPAAGNGSSGNLLSSLFQPKKAATNRTRAQRSKTTNKARRTSSARVTRESSSSLPGVNRKTLFGIISENETEELDEPIKVASVTNLARRGNHGLLLQRKDVQVGCFPPELVALLKKVERRFGRTPIVTSGYRSPKHNRRIRGARNSTHVHCKAADIQVKGISKFTLAKYLRSLPGRGGVGTYCHTRSVHIDVGTKRAWHYCGRKRSRGRRKRA